MDKKEQKNQELFIPPFTPPPVTKDWERSFDSGLIHRQGMPAKENKKVLRSLHFFFEEHERCALNPLPGPEDGP